MHADRPSQPFATVIETELGHIRARRAHLFPHRTAVAGEERDPCIAKPLGLTCSGGGIRSATFNLGVVQGLAELGLLKYVDYLSTVSGGGYIGSWLHGVINNRCQGDPDRAAAILSPRSHPVPGPPQDDPISFLRKFSNYLAPKPRLFGTDSWVIGVIWLRNVLLNQLILIPALGSIMLLALLLVFVQQIPTALVWPRVMTVLKILYAAGPLALLALATLIIRKNLDIVVRQTFLNRHATIDKTSNDVRWERASPAVVVCVFVAAVMLACAPLPLWLIRVGFIAGLVLLFAFFQVWGGFIDCYKHVHQVKSTPTLAMLHVIWMVGVAAAATGALVITVWRVTGLWDPWNRVAFAPPLICLSLLAGTWLHLGLMGTDYPDAGREWLARMGSMLALTCAGWSALFVIAVHAPKWFVSVLGKSGATGFTMIGGWVATTLGGVLFGRSPRSGTGEEPPAKGRGLGWITGAAPVVFVFGYLLLLSYGAHAALVKVSPVLVPSDSQSAPRPNRLTVDVRVPETAPGIEVDVRGPQEKGWLETSLEPVAAFADRYYEVLLLNDRQGRLRSERPGWLLAFLLGCLAVVGVAARRIDINEFSLHHFYKNRIVRCYLGASNSDKRKPNPFTGFDPADDFPISELLPTHAGGYLGPYAIVNVTLNLNAGSELAQQERKAASFVFTPEFCGFEPSPSREDEYATRHTTGLSEHGYRPTKGYADPSGPALGTAVAISGAAASPNSGYSTSGPMAFLLTVFDARLGWWLGNPRWDDASRRPGPGFALWSLLSELLAQTTSRSKFVNLSDGGHFDNLGLYELVRRRCRYIIIGDAEQDGELTFGSLGGAIRKCRADFGVEIDIDPAPIRLVNGVSQAHCVVGTITYPDPDTGGPVSIGGTVESAPAKARGWILYLKSSLTGDEPADVIEYRSRYGDFPHQSTSDQFFTESQFESYRRLGLHVVRDAFEGVVVAVDPRQKDTTADLRHEPPRGRREAPFRLDVGDGTALVDVFEALTRKWYAPIPIEAGDATRLNDAYSGLVRILRENPELKPLISELLTDFDGSRGQPLALDQSLSAFLVEVIQLMENVYTEYRLAHAANRANPRNAGWMTVFRRWAKSDALMRVWTKVKGDYNPLFRQFIDHHLQEDGEDMPPRP